ncbi:MAG TPA: UvrD-helicase domain-containing protein [Usitatibacter sp.]|nr:UvrD-helicase domain-containing protein [Usitatibacter sp.]
MDDSRVIPDLAQRERALDPRASFIVQAPAGSGKTELLIQRYLALLACVEKPEEIAAITFTRKAAAEMRARVLDALAFARREPRPQEAHRARTWDLARAAVERDTAMGWRLETARERLRVQTIDALCVSLARQMPVLSGFGAQPGIVEKAGALYAEAARNTIDAIHAAADPHADALAELLRHVDNDAARAEGLLALMLEKRDQWMHTLLGETHARETLEAALTRLPAQAVQNARAIALEAGVPGLPADDDPAHWAAFANTLINAKGQWKKAGEPYKANARLRHALTLLQMPSPARYSDAQWQALEVIRQVLRRAVAELKLVFARRGEVDFIELSQAAIAALEGEDGPTDLMLALDYRIRHVLVDEFQDTSSTQLELLEKLTSGWERGDGRTLFVVGDPMQSIYRFRHAEVALFLAAQREGIGGVALENLRLSANFRSQAGVVVWVNGTFARVMAPRDDLASGAVSYAPSEAVHPRAGEAVRYHAFLAGDQEGEAERVARLVREAQDRPPLQAGKPATVAVLVRTRTHLEAIVPRLRTAGLRFRAIEIEPLGERPVVQDLLALTRAITHLGDRTAWLAVLRAPWCGLRLEDLDALARQGHATVWEAMEDDFALRLLTPDGLERLVRTREALRIAIAARRRSSLRVAVESTWLALAGPACVEDATDLEDAEVYLDFLEAEERAGVLPDPAAFEQGVAALFALPDVHASEQLQVMTIHRAKGLEFDTVIVPGLGSGTAGDDRPLFLWLEGVGLAPITRAGGEHDDLYEYLRMLDKEKARHECERLLYVAATRARRELHLLACVTREEDGRIRSPASGSLLATLWPAVGERFAEGLGPPAPARAAAARKGPAPGELLVRLARPVQLASTPRVAWTAPQEPERDRIEFSWAGETARRVGSVVHRWLQRMAEDGLAGWNAARVAALAPAIRQELASHGVAESELEEAAARVRQALAGSLEDPRGRWLLGPHRRCATEWRLTLVVDGVPRSLVIDRFFEDAEGRAWIVDYKTSTHEGGDLERFLAEEQRRYAPQLERYAAAALAGQNASLGLYFPLLRGWREWHTDTETIDP